MSANVAQLTGACVTAHLTTFTQHTKSRAEERYMLTGRVEIRDNVRSMFASPLITVVQERRGEQWDVDGHSTGLQRRHTGAEICERVTNVCGKAARSHAAHQPTATPIGPSISASAPETAFK
ncbi:unnamed protein product [Pleuronectes platessa]|uniref:Uncharacterized protein n=1 Tax=Pleuronectes platessa TaxID=8262 RepID=A0A9N7VKI1_PLEPL|nr:unnamed protein product [Pleuronectes platessa]